METLAFIVGFRVYWIQRKNNPDTLDIIPRLATILGAMLGALIVSRLIGYLEVSNDFSHLDLKTLYYNKSIAGGFFGGILGVEFVKSLLRIRVSTGDVYVIPILIALIIGRIGCFLSGIDDGTVGLPTDSILGMDLGDGIPRLPTALFELIYAAILLSIFLSLKKVRLPNGYSFFLLMLLYFGFRFCIEFLKPRHILYHGLNAVQWCSIAVFIYYFLYLSWHRKHLYERNY